MSRNKWKSAGFVMLAASALFEPIAADARDLTVVSWGGEYQDAQRKYMFGPFTAESHIPVIDEYWEGGIGNLRTRIRSGSNTWDVVQVEAEEAAIGCEEGLFERMDLSKVGGADRFLPGTTSDCSVGAVIYNVVLAYDASKNGPKPESWADFFDIKKFPGKRAVRNGPKWTALRLTSSTRCFRHPKASIGRSRSSIPSRATFSSGSPARSRRKCWRPAMWS